MNPMRRIEEGVAVAERLKDAQLALAKAREDLRQAELEAYSNREIVDGKTAEVRKAQARQFTAPLERRVAELDAEVEYLRNHFRLVESTPVTA